MHQNIRNNNVKSLDAKLYNAKYYDFMLYKGDILKQGINDLKDISLVDFSDLKIEDGVLYSTSVWSGATNNGVEMNDIGLTGMDNGLISFKKDRITNEEFFNLLINSQQKIESGDTRLFLTPINGNTQRFTYPLYLIESDNEKYIACKGGFYQGFFKLFGHNYQVLPNKIDGEWFMHFEIRPRTDYEVNGDLINFLHPDNEGIFFFMGTRAENKFWPFYKTDSGLTESMKKTNAQTEGYFNGCGEISGETYNITENNVVFLENEWVADEIEKKKEDNYFSEDEYIVCEIENKINNIFKNTNTNITINNNYYPTSEQGLNVYDFNSYGFCGCSLSDKKNNIQDACECDDYFGDDFYNDRCPEIDNNKSIDDNYIGLGLEINKNGYDDSMGHAMSATGYNDIITDNKFLMFDRTPSGFTIENWIEGSEVMLTRRQNWPNANYFLLMNRTSTGYTIDTIDQYNSNNQYDYNLYKDIRGNVFALRIKKDGSIGYRYGVLNCENENNFELIEEYSKPNLIKLNEWNSINVRFSVLNPTNKMKIMFYVNGFLVFVSKEIDAFNFKNIDEVPQKQETVPYNISLGGGTLGLLESILPNYYAISQYVLPIEKNFCGSFMGDIKSFKMYGGLVNYSTITNYLS